MSSWLRMSRASATGALPSSAIEATMYWRIQITWSAHSRRMS